ncbi:MAG: YraN family protein [Acidobacteriota bacterium]
MLRRGGRGSAGRGQGLGEALHRRAKGALGERRAARWLTEHGFCIRERNFSCPAGEIDLVAEEADTLCFIEVKARSSREYGVALEAVTPAKQRRIARTAAWYLGRHPTELPCRFDVLAMDLEAGEWRYTLVRDAFQIS